MIIHTSFLKEKTILIFKIPMSIKINYLKIINNHISHLKFSQEELEDKIILKFETTDGFLEAFEIINNLEKK